MMPLFFIDPVTDTLIAIPVGLLLAGLLHLHINNRWHELPSILRHIFR